MFNRQNKSKTLHQFKYHRSLWLNVIITLGVAIMIFLIFLFAGFKGDITGFYCIGSDIKCSPLLEKQNVRVVQGNGNDGQLFLSLALDPLLLNPATKDALGGNPYYRAKRIMFPVLGYIFGSGNPQMIIYSLAIINFIGLVFLVIMASCWLKQHFKPLKWALVILAIPSIWTILSMSTSEIYCILFSLSALYFFRKNNTFLTIVFLTVAIFTRETAVFAFLAILLQVIFKKNYHYIFYLIIPFILFALWNIYLNNVINDGVANSAFFEIISVPFVGIFQKILSFFSNPTFSINYFFDLGCFILLMLVAFTGATTAWKNFKEIPEIAIMLFTNMLLLVMFTKKILGDSFDYLRVGGEVYFYSFIILPWASRFVKIILIVASVVISLGYIIGFCLNT